MNDEREGNRKRSGAATPAAERHTIAPGQVSLSSRLRRPEHPVASPLGQRDPKDASSRSEPATDSPTAAVGGTLLAEVPYRAEMERAFNQDFGAVRAKVGGEAELADIGAIGASCGDEIAFASPTPDRVVVAHELAHYLQRQQRQGAGSASSAPAVEDVGSGAEQEAERVAADVAAGKPAPQITQAPTARVARAVPTRNAPPTPPPVLGAAEWVDQMLFVSPLRTDVAIHLASARLPVAHPRLAWNAGGHLPLRVWANVANAARLQLVVAPFDLLARIDRMRGLGVDTGPANTGALSYMPEVATIIAQEIESAVGHCVQRLGPRLVAAFDARLGSADAPATDAATISREAIVVSHPLDRIVDDLVRQGSIATIRRLADNEPVPDRAIPGTPRPITYRWVDDPAMWNWIRTTPTDATPEEVANQVLGTSARAYEVHGSAPFFALPVDHVRRAAPDRATAAASKAFHALQTPGFRAAGEEMVHGVAETKLAQSKAGEEAALVQAEHASGTTAQSDADASVLASRCHSQVDYMVDSYRELGAGAKLAPMAARLADRATRLPAMPAADYARFARLFAQQSSVLYVVAGELETLAKQARRLQLPGDANAPIDPRLAEVVDLVLEAGASSDLPLTAQKQLQLAQARRDAIPFDAIDAMLDDARARTIATDPLADTWGPGDSGSTKASTPMNGRKQWQDLRSREVRLSGDVLAARRAHDAGTEKAGALRVLTERTRALQIEARLVAAETQCSYMGDKLEEQEGVVATVARQMHELQNARHVLQALATAMAGIRIRWREKHAQLFALVEADADSNADPAVAIRRAIAELEAELLQVGDDKTRAALETAMSELGDMAVARAVVDIAVMIGLTIATSGLGAGASGLAHGLRMGRTAAQLVNVATQSMAMATLRTVLYHDSFSSAFGSELLTNLAGLGALRAVAAGMSRFKVGKALAVLKDGGGAWKYVAHGTELTIEAATQAGLQFAVAQADSLVHEGRALNGDELKSLAIQGIGMFVGNAIAHRVTKPALDAISAYAAKVGKPYRRAKVREFAARVSRTGDAEQSMELIREERALLAEELAVLEQIARDPAERAQFGEQTLATVTDQAHQHLGEVNQLGAEQALQQRLTEIAPGKAWEGSADQVAPALADARAAGATVHDEQLGDGSRRHTVWGGTNRYTVYERSATPAADASVSTKREAPLDSFEHAAPATGATDARPADAHGSRGENEANPVRSARGHTEDDPAAGLPPDLRDVAVVRSSELNGTDVVVRYRSGTVRIEIGPSATARHVRYHIPTARRLLEFRGPLGFVRRLVDAARTKLRLTPGYGRAGFEGRAEVAKLLEIERELVALRGRLEQGAEVIEHGRALETGTVETELANVQEQLELEAARIDSYEPGKGFVAARDIPVYPVALDAVTMTETEGLRLYEVAFTALTKEGYPVPLGEGTVKLSDDGGPAEYPEFSIFNYAHYQGREHKAKLYPRVVDQGGNTVPVGEGDVVPLTQYVIARFIKRYEARFGHTPEALGGILAFENKANFQIQFAKFRRGMTEDQAKVAAAREISYGKHRIAAGYSELEVDLGARNTWEWCDVGDGHGKQFVPTRIKIVGRKP